MTRVEPDERALAAAAATVRRTGAIAFRVGDGRVVAYRVRDGGDGIEALDSADGARTVVALSAAAWDDYVQQLRTSVNLLLAGELAFERGDFDHLADWDPVLRLLHAGTPIYDPTRVDLSGVDLDRRFTLDDTDDDLRRFLLTTGFLHVRGVFSAAEMAAANVEVDRLAAEARPGDDRSWWATSESGEQVLCRLIYASLRSEVLAAMEADPRVARLGRLLDPELRAAPDRMEGAAVLLKVPGRPQGLSNIPWHQDCGMGGHAVFCPAAAVGIQLTGSSAATGNLAVVPGSHGQTLHTSWESRFDGVPVVEVDTEPGDVTVHVQDVMHASPPPTGEGGRRTLYVTHYPATLWDHIGPGQAFNDLIRARADEAAALNRW